MLVVSDATPLNALIRGGFAHILQDLFVAVTVPPAVVEELTRPATPEAVRNWMQNRPAWLEIKSPVRIDLGSSRNRGEREAISLALEMRADLLLVDDRRARSAAQVVGITCVGTIGVIEAAAAKDLLNIRQAFVSLPQDFLIRVDPRIIEDALARDQRRRKT